MQSPGGPFRGLRGGPRWARGEPLGAPVLCYRPYNQGHVPRLRPRGVTRAVCRTVGGSSPCGTASGSSRVPGTRDRSCRLPHGPTGLAHGDSVGAPALQPTAGPPGQPESKRCGPRFSRLPLGTLSTVTVISIVTAVAVDVITISIAPAITTIVTIVIHKSPSTLLGTPEGTVPPQDPARPTRCDRDGAMARGREGDRFPRQPGLTVAVLRQRWQLPPLCANALPRLRAAVKNVTQRRMNSRGPRDGLWGLRGPGFGALRRPHAHYAITPPPRSLPAPPLQGHASACARRAGPWGRVGVRGGRAPVRTLRRPRPLAPEPAPDSWASKNEAPPRCRRREAEAGLLEDPRLSSSVPSRPPGLRGSLGKPLPAPRPHGTQCPSSLSLGRHLSTPGTGPGRGAFGGQNPLCTPPTPGSGWLVSQGRVLIPGPEPGVGGTTVLRCSWRPACSVHAAGALAGGAPGRPGGGRSSARPALAPTRRQNVVAE